MHIRSFLSSLAALATLSLPVPAQEYGTVFDEHWERLDDEYPFFERYGVDWKAEREDHRPRAVAAKNDTEFAWEMARMISCVKDSHTAFIPSPNAIRGWSFPDVRSAKLEGRSYIVDWKEQPPVGPERYRSDPLACPEIILVQGTPMGSAVEILAAGPVGTTVQVRLRWPDGSETDEQMLRPHKVNLPPPERHFGEDWIVSGRVGSIGYIRVRTFSPESCTLGPAGKMTPILREHLTRLVDTEGLILDLQGNGGGMVAASDPFLSHFLSKRRSYRWGNSRGKRRVLVPRRPRYSAPVAALVDERTASGGEWAARILRDAGNATVIGGRTRGAEAAVHRFVASDGSTIMFSAWPMDNPGDKSFQDDGVELDHALPLTIEDVREHGFEKALERIRRARYAQALEVLGAPTQGLDKLLELATVEELATRND